MMHYSMIIVAVFLLNIFHPGQYVLRHKGGFKHDNLDNSKTEAGLWKFFVNCIAASRVFLLIL